MSKVKKGISLTCLKSMVLFLGSRLSQLKGKSTYLALVGFYVFCWRDVLFFPELIAGTDFIIPPRDPMIYILGFISSWDPHGLGSPVLYPGWAGAVVSIFVFISAGDQVITQKLLFSHFLISSFTMYFFLTNHFTESKLFGFAGAILYAYSPFTLNNFGTPINWGYALLPLFFNYMLNIFDGKLRIRNPVLLALSLVLIYSFYRDVAALLSFIVFIFFLINIIVRKPNPKYVVDCLKYYGISFAVFVASSFVLFAGLYYYGRTELQGFIPALETFFVRYAYYDIVGMFRLTGIGDKLFHPLDFFQLARNPIGFALPILAFLSIFVTKKEKTYENVLAFVVSVVFLIAFVMSVQGRWDVFIWLYHYYPLTPTLCSPHSTLALMCFLYSGLITSSIDGLKHVSVHIDFSVLKKLVASRSRMTSIRSNSIKSICVMLILFSLYFSYLPAYDTALHRFSIYTFPNPPVYGKVIDWMRSRGMDGSFRYILVPFSRTAVLNMVDEYPYGFHVLGAQMPIARDYIAYVNNALVQNRTTHIGSLLAPANVKYAIIVLNTTEFEFDKWQISGPLRYADPFLVGSHEEFVNALSHQKDLKPIARSNDFMVYENTRFIPHIAVFPTLTYVIGNMDVLTVLSHLLGFDIRNNLVFFNGQAEPYNRHLLNMASTVVFDCTDLDIRRIESISETLSDKKLLFLATALDTALMKQQIDPSQTASPWTKLLLRTSIYIPREAHYWISLPRLGGVKSLEVEVDRSQVPIENGEINWFESQPTFLSVGWHEIAVTLQGFILDSKIDKIMLSSDEIGNLFDGQLKSVTYSAEKVSEVEYRVTLHCHGPTFVVLGQSYHPEWHAYLDDHELPHFAAFSVTNGFYANASGTSLITMKFERQQTHVAMVYIGVGTFIVSIAIILYDLLDEKRKCRKKVRDW